MVQVRHGIIERLLYIYRNLAVRVGLLSYSFLRVLRVLVLLFPPFSSMPMPGGNEPSTSARAHVVKEERSEDMQERDEEAKNNNKSKGQGKGKGKAKAGNHVLGGGSPVRELSTQSKKGGPSHQNQNHSQQQKRPPKQQQHQNRNQDHHRNGQPSGSASSTPMQDRRGHDGGGGGSGRVHAGQKRRATENVTNGITGTDDGDRGQAPKRQKSEKRPQPPPPSRSGPDPKPNADLPGAKARPHPDFWYPDGSVIIQVEKTKFKLHQSTLQRFSAYFAATFGKKGNHKRGGRVYLEVERGPNGHHLPVYRVTETTADDFAMLLTVIEESTRYTYETPMPVLAGILRAARALSFEKQRQWAERIFERMWPATLDTLTTDPIPHAAVALVLARTCGLRGAQKRASYELLRMPTFGQAVRAPAAHMEVEEDPRVDAHADMDMGLDELPRADLLKLLHAREQLVLAWAEIAGKAPTDFVCPRGTQTQIMPESGGGSSTSSNNDGRRMGCASASADRVHVRWAELVHTTGLYVQRMVDPLMGLQDLMKIPWREEGFCKKCVAARTNTWEGFRRKIWDDLDVWLQLTDVENA